MADQLAPTGTSATTGTETPAAQPTDNNPGWFDYVSALLVPIAIVVATYWLDKRQKKRDADAAVREKEQDDKKDLHYKEWLHAREDREQALAAIFDINRWALRLHYSVKKLIDAKAAQERIALKISKIDSLRTPPGTVEGLRDDFKQIKSTTDVIFNEYLEINVGLNVSVMQLSAVIGEHAAAGIAAAISRYIEIADRQESFESIHTQYMEVVKIVGDLGKSVASNHRTIPRI